MYADAHIHLDLFPGDRLGHILAVAREAGVTLAVTVATNLDSSEQAVQIATQHEGIWAGIGIHPWEADVWREEWGDRLRELARSSRVKVMSEIGLDYSHAPVQPPPVQQALLVRQIALARELRLPLMTHQDGLAENDLLKVLRAEGAGDLGGIIHGFRGEYRFAAQCLDLGFVLSFGTALLRSDAWALTDLLHRLPRDGIVLETDAAGGEDGPAEVLAVAEHVAGALELTPEQVGMLTTDNLRRVLRL